MWLKQVIVFYIVVGTFFYKGISSSYNVPNFKDGNSDVQKDLSSENEFSCPEGFYLARDLCYKIIKKPYLPVNSPRACDYIENTTYANRTCECSSNYYYDAGHCYKIPSGPNVPVDSAIGCEYLANTTYLNGKCECSAHFYLDANHCFRIPENPYDSVDTPEGCKYLENTIYTDGMCHCSGGYYYESKHCYKIPSGINVQVNSAKACDYLPNTTYSNGRCECLSNYYLDDDHCYRIPPRSNIPVDSAKACEHLYGTLFYEGKCVFIFEDEYSQLSEDFDPSFSRCADNTCRCEPNYFGANNKCYGYLGANCSTASDCFSSSYSCQSGTCQKVEYQQEMNVLSSKPGISAYWTQNKSITASQGVRSNVEFKFVCRVVFNKITLPGVLHSDVSNRYCDVTWGSASEHAHSYELLIGPNVEWKKSPYSFDKAIYGGHTKDNKPILICNLGTLEKELSGYLLPPFYDSCFFNDHTSVRNYNEFYVLVEK